MRAALHTCVRVVLLLYKMIVLWKPTGRGPRTEPRCGLLLESRVCFGDAVGGAEMEGTNPPAVAAPTRPE